MSSITSTQKKIQYRPNVIKRSPTKKTKKNEKESSISLNNIELELQNNSPKEIKRSNKSNNKKNIDEEKNNLKKENEKKGKEKEENKNENNEDKNYNAQNGKTNKKKVLESPKRRPGRKYVKINDNVEIISVENWKQYNCDVSEGGQKHIICKCCNIL